MTPPKADQDTRGLIDHIFLPPQLPQREDSVRDLSFIQLVQDTLDEYQLLNGRSVAIDHAKHLVTCMKRLHADNTIDELQLRNELPALSDNESLAVHVRAQNAGVIITRKPDALLFEAFELSSTNAAVFSTKDRLVRTFPAVAVALHPHILADADFAHMVAQTLATMSAQKAMSTQQTTKKAGTAHEEDRDTASPALVSELFLGMLRGCGAVEHKTSAISKRVREEVLYHKARRPWRRSPTWLLIRVALQLAITRAADGSTALYKNVLLLLMKRLLSSAHEIDLAPEMLFIMHAKIDQRRLKLLDAGTLDAGVAAVVAEFLQISHSGIVAQWEEMQTSSTFKIPLTKLSALDFRKDTVVTLSELDEYIGAIRTREGSCDQADYQPACGLLADSGGMPQLPSQTSPYAAQDLQTFEHWVTKSLDKWAIRQTSQHAVCMELCQTIKSYHAIASNIYANNPEGISLMLLVIFELWIALDQAAVGGCDLLREYDCGMSQALKVAQNLLLPFLDQMKRLDRVEKYLQSRVTSAGRSWKAIFDMDSARGFPNRYYSTSQDLQALHQLILTRAEKERQAKREELQDKKLQYARLDDLYSGMECEYFERVVDTWCDPPETIREHSNGCRRCAYGRQRDGLSIQVHEWPLPDNIIQAQAIVFELRTPVWFAYWREARFFVLHRILGGSSVPVRAHTTYLLSSNDPHLSRQYSQAPKHRIGMLSQTKPVLVTHYSGKQIATSHESTVCVRNGLSYRYYDSESDSYIADFTYDNSLPIACTYRLPQEVNALQKFLLRPASSPDGPTPNTVLASQHECPQNMVLEEFKELAMVPSGHRIQWSNIILQLAVPNVDFKKVETSLVFLQAMYQAGPPSPMGDVLRQSHSILNDDMSAKAILENLEIALQRVKENWESVQALSTFVAITTRVLSLSRRTAVRNACLSFLVSARTVASDWLIDLREKKFSARDQAEQSGLVSKSVEVALVCASTFDVDDELLHTLLLTSEARHLIGASIVVQEGHNIQDTHIPRLELRFKRLLHRGYTILVHNGSSLNVAVKDVWSGFEASSTGWSQVADHWTTTNTVTGARVHYNLLDGELLVNGLPLDQPPQHYRKHQLYQTLFSDATVDIMPASEPGFQFSTKRRFGGCKVLLGLQNGQLIVRATNEHGSYEAVSCSTLQGSYPQHFVNDYVHWYSLTTGVVTFQPKSDPWSFESSPSNWLLSNKETLTGWRLMKSDVSVAGSRSPSAKVVSQVLNPIAGISHTHCLLQPDEEVLCIDLPPLRLGFNLSKGSTILKSREYRSMVVDDCQSLGTLVGFENKLILRCQQSGKRQALILQPNQSRDLEYRKVDLHVNVYVQSKAKCIVHAVGIDGTLQRLQDNGTLDCKLYLAYLHALTSSCLPDPCTLKTGTEQALTILRSKAVESFSRLSQSNVDMLSRISGLSPGRSFYPRHERVMQTIAWDGQIHFLSQHEDFAVVAWSLLRQSEANQFFYPGNKLKVPRPKDIEPLLQDRARIRSSTFRVFGSGAEHRNALFSDREYEARDRASQSARASRAAQMSTLVLRNGDAISWDCPTVSELFHLLSSQPVVHGVRTSIDISRIRYDASLLQDGTCQSFIAKLPALRRCFNEMPSLRLKKFSSMAWLCTMSFANDADMAYVQLIAMCYKSRELTAIEPPLAGSFNTKAGHVFNVEKIRDILSRRKYRVENSPEWRLPRDKNEKAEAYNRRRKHAWQTASDLVVTQACQLLRDQWPSPSPRTPGVVGYSTYINQTAMAEVKDLFATWHDNRLLHAYLCDLLSRIRDLPVQAVAGSELACVLISSNARSSMKGILSENDLFLESAAPVRGLPSKPVSPNLVDACESVQSMHMTDDVQPRISGLVRKMQIKSQSTSEIEYANDLEESMHALISSTNAGSATVEKDTSDHLRMYLTDCETHTKVMYDLLIDALTSSPKFKAALEVSRLPRLSPEFLLKQLARDRWSLLSTSWQKCVTEYALSLTALQRAELLVRLSESKRNDEIVKELQNVGHVNWDPYEFPETLLIEAESGIMVREVQEQIAGEMREPASGRNAVMQLNMGEGKSSVIIPITAAALADGSQLVRVIVAKPQSKQMADMLISKVGGLVGRRVYYMPFARALQPSQSDMAAIEVMVKECMTNGGILLVQPEHILSFKLTVPETYLSGEYAVAKSATATQDFFDRYSRDLVDESDENFSPRFELIYTMGMQRPVEASPHRWFLLQQVLALVSTISPKVAAELPSSIDVVAGTPGSFPRTRILRMDAAELLVSRLAEYICDHGLDGFPISRQTLQVRKAVYAYITEFSPPEAQIKLVENNPMVWTEANRPHLLVLRGLFADGVLSFVLSQKRWRVNYGLANRSPPIKVAVPYRAKDTPAPRSEFSHPDVVIALTLLCYYYQGLDDEQLFAALGHLSQSDQAEITFQEWVKDSNGLSPAFTTLKGINLKDRTQCISKIFPALRHGKSVVDYFVSTLVFPKEMKEFPDKLSASGWDIGKARDRLTTGFSGTIDSRHLLPLDVRYLELPQQKHTNALVMEHLLEPNNGVHIMSSVPATTGMSDAENLLSCVMQLDPPVQVILDVGAQILELDNLGMAKAWLQLHDSKEAVVFVNKDDEICIVDRSGQIDLLRASPYQSRLDACLVFLDEAHTRGIDLVLPLNYRAAVTLGPRLTKDRLVQACMRMRKLGKGQTVVFCISEEIQTKILEAVGLNVPADITVSEVLEWSMQETLDELRRNVPLWAVQGERFERQEKVWHAARNVDGDTNLAPEDAKRLLEAEAQSLDDRYRPCQNEAPKAFANRENPVIRQIADKCQAFDITHFKSSALQEEQERELSPEMEQERQVQQAPPATPAKHHLHPDVVQFAATGTVVVESPAYTDAFSTLKHISAAAEFLPSHLKGDRMLLATKDFAETVARQRGPVLQQDSFLRSVQWILTSHDTSGHSIKKAMIISPYEANILLPRMAKSTNTSLHLYRARVNSGYASLDDLSFHTTPARNPTLHFPRSLAIQLNLFAGQLYINSHADYLEVCTFLGLLPQRATEEMENAGWQVDAAGFILCNDEGEIGGKFGLPKSPVGFLRSLIGLRRNGDGFGKTPVGRLLEGAVLRQEEFVEESRK